MADPPARPFLRRGPSGPLQPEAITSIVQVGSDMPIKENFLFDQSGLLPRDGDGSGSNPYVPIEVELLGVTPGNYLEFDFSGQFFRFGGGAFNSAEFFIMVYTGDAEDVPFPPGPDSYWVQNANAQAELGDASAGNPPSQVTVRSLAMVQIPEEGVLGEDGRVRAVIIFQQGDSESFGFVGSESLEDIDGSEAVPVIKVTEYNAAVITQPPPSKLVPIIP